MPLISQLHASHVVEISKAILASRLINPMSNETSFNNPQRARTERIKRILILMHMVGQNKASEGWYAKNDLMQQGKDL